MGNLSNGEKPTIWGTSHIKKSYNIGKSRKKFDIELSYNLGNYYRNYVVGNSRNYFFNPKIWGNSEKRICCSKYHSNNMWGIPQNVAITHISEFARTKQTHLMSAA
jgi:hypothetical protein